MTKEYLEKLIDGCETEKQVYKKLDNAGISYSDKRKEGECDYFNVTIGKNPKDFLRIYQKSYYGRKEFVVQRWTRQKFEYSGIPTFFATNSYF